MVCMEYIIRKLKQEEVEVLDTFLYEAIFIPEGIEAPSKDIIEQPELQVYIDEFGNKQGDICFVAEIDNTLIGAVWVRIMNDYGHIDDATPSFAISLLKEYRGDGIGTKLKKRKSKCKEICLLFVLEKWYRCQNVKSIIELCKMRMYNFRKMVP